MTHDDSKGNDTISIVLCLLTESYIECKYNFWIVFLSYALFYIFYDEQFPVFNFELYPQINLSPF